MTPHGARVRAASLAWSLITVALTVAPAVAEAPQELKAWVTGPSARLGERIVYHGQALFPNGAGSTEVRWQAFENDERFSWGKPSARLIQGNQGRRAGDSDREPAPAGFDTARVEIDLQVFAIGDVTIPGMRFAVMEGSRAVEYRLPDVTLVVVPVLTAADSNASLRPLRGPLSAPWWERVPWLLVLLGLALIAAAVLVARRLRRRRPATIPAPVPVRPILDPLSEAMRELAALRRLGLPQQGRFGEHALMLSRILRRFLERALGLLQPGDTTREVVQRLDASGVGAAERVGPLLSGWDLVKFARAPSDVPAAEAGEQGVEAILRETAVRTAPSAPAGAPGAARPTTAGHAAHGGRPDRVHGRQP